MPTKKFTALDYSILKYLNRPYCNIYAHDTAIMPPICNGNVGKRSLIYSSAELMDYMADDSEYASADPWAYAQSKSDSMSEDKPYDLIREQYESVYDIISSRNVEYYSDYVLEKMENNEFLSEENKEKCILNLNPDMGIIIKNKDLEYFYHVEDCKDETNIVKKGFIHISSIKKMNLPKEKEKISYREENGYNGYILYFSSSLYFEISLSMEEDDIIDVRLVSSDKPTVEKPFFILDKENSEIFKTVMNCLIFKQMIEVDSVVVNKKSNPKQKLGKQVYQNKTDIDITVIDSNWIREIIRTESFGVRGHFRLQPYGEGMKKRKLKWIKPFVKKGYHRRAGKTLKEENE